MSNLSQFFGGGKRRVQVFTSSGTWIRPDGVEAVDVLVGAGGGGGGGRDSASTLPGGVAGGSSSFGDITALGGLGGESSAGAQGIVAGGKGGGLFGGLGITGTTSTTPGTLHGNATGFLVGGGAGHAKSNTSSPVYQGGSCPGFGSGAVMSGGASYKDAPAGVQTTSTPNAPANSGCGGQGGWPPAVNFNGAGGGGGEVRVQTNVPVTGNVIVTVGAGGSGGAGNQAVGGNGGSGIVIVAWDE